MKSLEISEIRDAFDQDLKQKLQTIALELYEGRSPGTTLPDFCEIILSNYKMEGAEPPTVHRNAIDQMLTMNGDEILQSLLGGITRWLKRCNTFSEQELYVRCRRNSDMDGGDGESPFDNLTFDFLNMIGNQLNQVEKLLVTLDSSDPNKSKAASNLISAQLALSNLLAKLKSAAWQKLNNEQMRAQMPDPILKIILDYLN